MITLGIETSCDETGVALYDTRRGLLAHALHSQAEMHADYGGIVPELASRDHIRHTLPLIEGMLDEHGLAPSAIDAVAHTVGPGLVGALLTGSAIAQGLAWALGRPAVGVHHMEAHLLAPMLEADPPVMPFVALLVSGGHTQLVAVERPGVYRVLGETVDDAAGEAFDKTAQLLGLGYPGGPAIAAAAAQGRPGRYAFPRPMTARPGLDFSFSGLKTAVRHALAQADAVDAQVRADIARSFEEAVVETLVIKAQRALARVEQGRLVVAGGVGANARLRHALRALPGVELHFPRPAFCTDNGAMIAYTGAVRLAAGAEPTLGVSARPRWPLAELEPFELAAAPTGGAAGD